MPKAFVYFAYGSNMLPERLQAPNRCPRAKPLGRAYVKGHKVSFAKRSRDDSGKATIEIASDPNSTVHGVLFRIGLDELGSLDAAEGAGNGYNRCDKYSVIDADGAVVEAVTYIADASTIDPNLTPYDWYRDLVVAGAIESELPESYVYALCDIVAQPDPEPDRKTRLEAMQILEKASHQYNLKRFHHVRDTRHKVGPIRDLLMRMENIIGAECYNRNIRNYGEAYQGRSFCYPVRFSLRNGEEARRWNSTEDLQPEELITGHYKFGSNELSIYRALVRVIDMLRNEYGLDLSRKAEK